MLDLFCYPFSPHFPQLVLPPTHTHTHTQEGDTALMAAAASQHEDIVELLTEVHADPDLQDEVIYRSQDNYKTKRLTVNCGGCTCDVTAAM